MSAEVANPPKKLVCIKAAAEALGVDPRTLSAAISAGDVKAVKLGSAIRVPWAEVLRLLAAKQ